MVVKSVESRWVRRYRTFFLIGILIFCFQILLAIRFLALNNDMPQNIWNPHKITRSVVEEDADSVSKASKNNQTHLRLEELNFLPTCEINTKEAISAIHRAKTQECKQKISNITCLINKGLLYPKYLPNYCSDGQVEKDKSMGCFKDEKAFRLLNGYYGNNKVSNSPEYCVKLCLQSGYLYAGVEYSLECFCGNEEPPSTARLPDSSCNMKCPADPHQACGGYFTINIYQTGIRKLPLVYGDLVPSLPSKSNPPIIVFLLTLNGRALRQVHRLLKILYSKKHYYYIHVDIRQDYLFRELTKLENQFPNIRVTRQRFATIWGGASLLEMLLSTMKELLNAGWKWDFVLNLSESDYPVKTIQKLEEFLGANQGKNYVKSHGREVQRFIQKQGLDKTFVECELRMWRIGDRELPWGIQIDGGSDWVALSRNFVEYVTSDSPDELVAGLLIVFKHTLLPAESFFHTVLRNSKFCDTYVDNNLHVTNWKRKLGCKCQYKHVVDWCGCSPNDFKLEDWSRIQSTESRQLFFARKFEPIVNQAVILQLERWLYGPEFRKEMVNLNSYWQNVFSYLDLVEVDDALLTFTSSAIRTHLKSFPELCALKNFFQLLDVNTYHKDDLYQMTLISYLVKDINNVKFNIEFGIKSINTFDVIKVTELTQRLGYLEAGSDYDQKEQILRNFAQILGPFSQIVLLYHFEASVGAEICNISFLWIGPSGNLADVTEIIVDESEITGHIKLTTKLPLLPGLWTVKMIYDDELLASLKFVIIPLNYYSGSEISYNQAQFINAGNNTFHEVEKRQYFEQFLPTTEQQKILSLTTITNSKKIGTDLEQWIDSLFVVFHRIESFCVVGNISNFCHVVFKNCAETSWSSFAPDPKSYLV